MSKKGLGKGLNALIKTPGGVGVDRPAAKAEGSSVSDERDVETGERVLRVALDEVVASPYQPRQKFVDDRLDELVESIREHGIIQPLVVREVDGRFELIAGERRWRASTKLELSEVPIIVREASDRDVLEMALIENLQREDLDPIEEAEAYTRLAVDFGLKQDEIAQRVGKKRATVANTMRLLDLDRSVRDLVSQKLITAGHAKAILAARTQAEQKMISEMVVKRGLTVRDTERIVAEQTGGKTTSKKAKSAGKLSPQAEAYVRQIQDQLRSRFSTNVMIQHGEKRGKIEIEYYGNEDLGRVLEILGVTAD